MLALWSACIPVIYGQNTKFSTPIVDRVTMVRPKSNQNLYSAWQNQWKRHCFSASLVLVVLLSPIATADVLTIPNVNDHAANHVPDIPLPTRGMTMEEVSAQFGDPQQKKSPVGDPPITRWVYDKFTVHFEGKYVIHSVVHRK
jgi:hypothetical protein